MGSDSEAPKRTGKVYRELAVAVAVAFARIFGTAHDPEGARRAREASLRAATRTVESETGRELPADVE
jgi:hypothetical protein